MTATADAYSNELEQMFGQLPGWLQGPLRPIYDKMDEALHWVAGNPDELLKAGGGYVQLGNQIEQLAQQQQQDRARLLAGKWDGEAYQAFSAKMAQLETQIRNVSTVTSNTKELLQAGAQACTEGANAICELVKSLLMMILGTIVVNVILSFFTFGLSIAAGVAEAIGEALAWLARIMQVVDKVASVIEKISELLQKLAEILKNLAQWLKALKALNSEGTFLKLLKNRSAAQLGKFGEHVAIGVGTRKALDGVTGGNVDINGPGGDFYHGGKDYLHARSDVQTAQHDASP